VQRIVAAICESQRPGGGWRVFWAEGSDPSYSVYALELLVWLGVIAKEELRARLLPFCS